MAEVVQSIFTVILLLASCLPAVLVAGGIAAFVYSRIMGGKKPIDVMKRMYEEMLDEAKVNKEPNLLVLERKPFLSKFDMRTLSNGSDKAIEKYTETIRHAGMTGTTYGRIIGHSAFDLMATVQDLLMRFDENPEIEEDEGLSKAQQKAQERTNAARKARLEEYTKILEDAGSVLHFFVYEINRGKFLGIFPRTDQRGIFAFDDQISGLGDDNGVVTLFGLGTARLAVYFQVLTGWQERLDIIRTHMVSYSRIYSTMMMESNIMEFVNRAIGGDSDFYKLVQFEKAKHQDEKPNISYNQAPYHPQDGSRKR